MIYREQMSIKCRKDYSSVLLLNLHPFFGLARENSSLIFPFRPRCAFVRGSAPTRCAGR